MGKNNKGKKKGGKPIVMTAQEFFRSVPQQQVSEDDKNNSQGAG